MVYIPPPQSAGPSTTSYAEAYQKILASYRQSPLTTASSVVLLVATDVDALCAARMLADLFKQDDLSYSIIPVSGMTEFGQRVNELRAYPMLHTIVLLNMGGVIDLTQETFFGSFETSVTIHVIDSMRPLNLHNLFSGGENAERVIVWDDGEADKLVEERKALQVITYTPIPDSDDEEEDDFSGDEEQSGDEDEGDDYEEDGERPRKRRSIGDGERRLGKRRQVSQGVDRDEYERHVARVDKYGLSGLSHGQSAACTIYILANVLERVDNDILWFAILGLTFQYTTSRISREYYESYHSIYNDEVSRLNRPQAGDVSHHALNTINPDDLDVRATDELRFTLFRHWNLYDAMFHSSYVASKLGIWKERGRKRLTGLLAKMGFSIPQTQQPYYHMDMDLKKQLISQLNTVAPEYGLVELSYPSFMRCFGYRSQPLSAADAVEGIGALLDVAGGIRIEVEVEGARNGGEWFGGGRVWETNGAKENARRRKVEERENVPPGGQARNGVEKPKPNDDGQDDSDEQTGALDEEWWVKNFWTAYDALTDISALREALLLSMSLHRAIIRQGTSIIDKQDIRTMRNYRIVTLTQGPDLALFAHPGVLTRLALWLIDALRDRLPATTLSGRSKRKGLPLVVACLNEATESYIVVGMMAALDYGNIRKNQFGLAFIDAVERTNARGQYATFHSNVFEIAQTDLQIFLEALCEAE
ncbi:cell division control protein 45 [Pleurotus eryngii]|uniref:Cell division control protein 45 n=1 Tax=Pleurotus eryngii TaxID=5323 RepID=A0A9P6DK00_PLEER|nr:cell division control protein 45 [Pleurotus eryngii]